MKNLIPVLLLALALPGCNNQKPENKEVVVFLNDAVNKAQSTNKILVLEFWAPECGPCIRLKRDIFNNSKTRGFIDSSFFVVQTSPADSIYKLLWKHFNLLYQSSVIFFDKKGNETDRTVSYNSDRDAYLNFLKEVSAGKNLFVDISSNYQKDTLNVSSSYLLAGKLFFRYQLTDAIKQYAKVLALDPDDKSGFNTECRYKIAECELTLSGNLEKMKEFSNNDIKNNFAPKAYEYLINDLLAKTDTLNCLALCKEAFKKYPESWEILNKYAWAICTFKIKDDYPRALEMVQKSIRLNPYRAGTYSTEAWIHFEMGNRAKAIESQNKGIEIYPLPAYFQDLEKFKMNKSTTPAGEKIYANN